jgi:hypothetical protein
MHAAPGGPGDHEGRLDPALLEAGGRAADSYMSVSGFGLASPDSASFTVILTV